MATTTGSTTPNLIDGATDEVGATATNIGIKRNIEESADGYACLDLDSGAGSTNDIALVLGWGRQLNTTQDSQEFGNTSSGHGVTNPRVLITFVSTVFST
jgi:hypothetical protein